MTSPLYRRPSSGQPAGDAIPFRHNDEAHLFFLRSPAGTTDYPHRVRTTWHHAVTGDLRSWTELPPAVEPGARDAVDADGAWTGSVIEHDGTYYLFYTGHQLDAGHPQTICLATSTDLVTFDKSPDNPVLLPVEGCEPIDWRDPYVFYNDQEGRFWMLLSARRATGPTWRRGCVMLATSDDLHHWQVEDEPLYEPGTTYCPECPELWELDGTWYLVYSRFSERAGTIYRVADNPRGPFRVPEHDELGGRRWYAAKSCPGPTPDRRIFFGWVHDRQEDRDDGRWYWGGDFAAPREVVAEEPGQLAVRLPQSVRELFTDAIPIGGESSATLALSAIAGFEHRPLGSARLPEPYLLDLTFTWDETPASFGLSLRTDSELSGWYLEFDRVSHAVVLSQSPHPLDDFWADLVGRTNHRRGVDGPHAARATLRKLDQAPGTVDVTLLVDGSLVEVYIDDRVALTHRIHSRGDRELGVFVSDGQIACYAKLRKP